MNCEYCENNKAIFFVRFIIWGKNDEDKKTYKVNICEKCLSSLREFDDHGIVSVMEIGSL